MSAGEQVLRSCKSRCVQDMQVQHSACMCSHCSVRCVPNYGSGLDSSAPCAGPWTGCRLRRRTRAAQPRAAGSATHLLLPATAPRPSTSPSTCWWALDLVCDPQAPFISVSDSLRAYSCVCSCAPPCALVFPCQGGQLRLSGPENKLVANQRCHIASCAQANLALACALRRHTHVSVSRTSSAVCCCVKLCCMA